MDDKRPENFLDKRQVVLVIGVAIISVALFVLGLYVGARNSSSVLSSPVFAAGDTMPPGEIDLRPVWKAWHTLEDRYVPTSSSTPVTNDERIWGLIQGLAASYGDPYTVFFPPEDAEIFEADISGNFEGVGMEIGVRDGVLTVIAPLKNTPAYRAGILAGDQIWRIDEESTDGVSADQAVKRIRGERGTPVVFTIAREGEDELLEIEVIRDVIEIPTLETTIRPDGIFVIELYNFSAVSPHLFREALRQFSLTGYDKLILDLRGNPGGFLEASVDMASWFLPAGEVVLTESFGNTIKPRVHRSSGQNVFDDSLKMAILIDQGSASASEILAGALSQHGVATLVGQQSFGKGSVQELVDITSDTALKVTIARWLTPNGTSISDGGLSPDIAVELTLEDLEAGLDPQLEKAVEILLAE